MKSQVAVLACLLFSCHLHFNGVDAIKMVCPEASEIAPAQCTRTEYDDGTSRTALVYDNRIESVDEIATIVQKIRAASGAGPEDLLEMDDCSFVSLGDKIETIDLAPFGRNNVTNLSVYGKFPQITGGQKDACYITNFFVIKSPNFAPANLNAVLSAFDASSLKTLYIQDSDLVGFPEALSVLTELRTLYLINGTVSSIKSDQFINNPNMVWIYLYNTGLTEIQERALKFSDQRTERSLYFLLAKHPITDSAIHPNNGLADFDGITMVSLTQTGVTSLSQSNWEGYLKNKNHLIMFSHNPLQCSPEMRWIKTEKKRLQRQVYTANCGNDKGKNVFNSELV